MKKIISLLLILTLVLSVLAFAVGCAEQDDPPEIPDGGVPQPPSKDEHTKIVKPEYKDYGRGTVDYANIEYVRPDIEAVANAFDSTAELIALGEVSYEEMLKAIEDCEAPLYNVKTMYAIAEINKSRDASDENWLNEYTYVTTEYPALQQALEGLFVAAAQSEYAQSFENDYFGDGLIEEYANGGKYSDEAVILLEGEALLEAEYSALSTSTVVIEYTAPDGEKHTGTYDELVEKLGNHYAAYIRPVYELKLTEKTSDIMLELVKIRYQIAEELGYDSYTEYAYEEMGYDYSAEKVINMLEDISTAFYPVYIKLFYYVFDDFFATERDPSLKYSSMINRLYASYQTLDSDIAEVFAYMLQHGLYDIEYAEDFENRFQGAFTTYLDSNSSPFLFVTATGRVSDYLTFSHEFGHFLDFYANNGSSSSLDLSEVYSQTFELLTMLKLKEEIGEGARQYLEYTAIIEAMDTIVYQGFLAYYEHLLYSLEYENITKESLSEIVDKAGMAICGAPVFDGDYTTTLIPHIVLYPHYVQSYCTSMITSLSIFFEEVENEGHGLEIYKNLISRDGDKTFEEYLALAGITSPFAEGVILDVADKLHFYILGIHYVVSGDDDAA